MPRVRLTPGGVATLSTEKAREEFWDTVTPGLILRVSGDTGHRTWYVRYRVNGSRRRQKLGTFPRLGLTEARALAREALRRADLGEDPAQERSEQKAEDRTFRALAREVLEARARKGRGGLPTRASTQAERARLVEKELLPAWGNRGADSITRREVVQLVEAIARRGAPAQANRVLSLITLIFNDGLRRGFPGLNANPAHMAPRPGVETPRDRYLRRDEIPVVWQALDEEGELTAAAFRLALLTGQRMGSVLAMSWDGIAGDLWTIPAEHFKGKRPHLAPLPAEALTILEDLRELGLSEEWVFPSRAGSRRPFISNLAGALRRTRERSALPHWVAHDFRTTFRTWGTRSSSDPMEPGLGLPAHVADAVLGHVEPTLGFSHYTADKLRYLLQEKREAVAAWGSFVRTTVEGPG